MEASRALHVGAVMLSTLFGVNLMVHRRVLDDAARVPVLASTLVFGVFPPLVGIAAEHKLF